jgi:hypothetical protein
LNISYTVADDGRAAVSTIALEVDAAAATWSGHMSLEEGEPNSPAEGVDPLVFTSSSLHNVDEASRKNTITSSHTSAMQRQQNTPPDNVQEQLTN